MPDDFIIDTPVGGYNPDWTLIKEIGGEDYIYFIAETKGSTSSASLQVTERQKLMQTKSILNRYKQELNTK